jgi:hypothetical protein
VRDDESGGRVPAVGIHVGLTDGSLGAGPLLSPAVGAAPGIPPTPAARSASDRCRPEDPTSRGWTPPQLDVRPGRAGRTAPQAHELLTFVQRTNR